MSVKNIAQLKTDTDNTIFENTTESITGAAHNALLKDILDSSLNRLTDEPLIGLSEFSASVSYSQYKCVAYQGGIYQCINPSGHSGAWADADFNLIAGNSSEEGVVATGTNLATAYQIKRKITFFDTVAAGTGGKFSAPLLNQEYVVWNFGANDLLLYPTALVDIGAGVGNPITISPGVGVKFIATSTVKMRQI